jgi:hypothetical protein
MVSSMATLATASAANRTPTRIRPFASATIASAVTRAVMIDRMTTSVRSLRMMSPSDHSIVRRPDERSITRS